MMRGKAQQGSAGALFIMFLPMMLLSVGFVIYTSQQLLTHIRTLEAVEVASLAVVADTKNESLTINDHLHRMINRYVNDTYNIELDIKAYDCSYANGCAINNKDGASKGFTINASTWHEPWLAFLPSTDSTSAIFTPPFKVSSGSVTTARYVAPPVDIYFIADFSSSMGSTWGYIEDVDGNNVRVTRLKLLIDSIHKVLNYLESTQDPAYPTRVGLSTYNGYNFQKIDGDIYHVGHNYREGSASFPEYTVDMMWVHPRDRSVEDFPALPGENTHYRNSTFKKSTWNRFHDINPTTDYTEFMDTLNTFIDGGGTYSWQGLISAAQMADKATQDKDETNPTQIFILIGDGADGAQSFTRKLIVDYGLCEKIRTNFENKEHRFSHLTNSKISVTFGVIGLNNLVINANQGYSECFGDNIFLVEDASEDMTGYIFSLINETSGRFVE